MSEERDSSAPSARRGVLRSALFALFIAALIAFWIWSNDAERRAIRNLPATERAGVYQRTLENFQSVCASADLALEEYCRDQARTLLAFPECDESCRELAHGRITRGSP
jgi:hypothetical protein